ncbi:MAG: glycosyltransferase [Beijerinckiaceae bacterium]|nr:glycosyltransferase [Beijerinckiaceae bacterium]
MIATPALPKPVLSVVIPTYKRERYIRRCLDFHLAAFADAPFPIEIVVSDNCSPDGTPALLMEYAANPMLQPVLRGRTGNVYENMITAYHHARGDFVTYIGDDDYLIPEKIYEYVADLQQNETIVALYAPWFQIDETQDNATIGQFFGLDEIARFGRDDVAAAMNLVLDRHIFPEFAIFRRDHVHAIVDLNQDQAYWAFVWMTRALLQGEILFMPEPFARITAVSANDKGHTGNEEVMVSWDRYRGGLEFAIAPLLDQGRLSAAEYQMLRAKVDQFVAQRMYVAVNFHRAARNWIEAWLLNRRLTFAGMPNMRGADLADARTLAAFQSSVREAIRLGADKIAVDPSIPDALIAMLPQTEQDRLTRSPQESAVIAPWTRALIVFQKDFAQPISQHDLVVDLNDSLRRFQ